MPRRLRYADEAILDLDAIRRWQTQPGSGPAAIRRLKQTPCLYAVGDYPGVRELPYEGHRVMYIAESDTGRNNTAGDVLVLRVFGPGQSRKGF